MLPLELPVTIPSLYRGTPVRLTFRSGMLALLGPNGSGKSQLLRQMKQQLAQRGPTLLLGAGRLQPLESQRLLLSPYHSDPGQQSQTSLTLDDSSRPLWHQVETVQGVLNRLSERVDLQIKVAERLRALFGREMRLVWDRGNLEVEFVRGSATYPSFREASGLLHLVAMLAALYDGELTATLIDEPELSLHPQYQAFVRREIERVAGDPAAGRKLVIYATHAPAMVRLRSVADLPDVVFFSDADTPPTQVDPSAGELRNQKLSAFVRTLGAGHREALFAKRPLVVEGPSDEVVVDALNAAAGTNLHAAGGHILAATGKGSMPTILKLLRLTGKEPAALADLDAFTDDLGLVQACNDVEEGRLAALGASHASLHAAAKPVHELLATLATTRWDDISPLAVRHAYWTDGSGDEAKRKRRAVAAVLLRSDEATIGNLPNGAEHWLPLRRRLTAVLDLLETAGLFVLRHGTIEDSFAAPADRSDKVAAAWAESDAVADDPSAAEARHAVALRALRHVARAPSIDESAAVAKAFLAVVAPVLDELRRKPAATQADLDGATRHARDVAGLFSIARIEGSSAPRIEVQLAASGLDVMGFPLVVGADDNVNSVAQTAIRPKPPNSPRDEDLAPSPSLRDVGGGTPG